jgi:hypothetical protein
MQTHDTRSPSWTWRRQTEVDELDAAVTALHTAADTSPDPERVGPLGGPGVGAGHRTGPPHPPPTEHAMTSFKDLTECPTCHAEAGQPCNPTAHYGPPPTEVVQAANRLDGPRALAELWTMLNGEQRGGWSSNDLAQAVDDWFTEHGFPTILYA